MAELIDGKKISQDLKDEVKAQVSELKAKGVEVALAVIMLVTRRRLVSIQVLDLNHMSFQRIHLRRNFLILLRD